MCEELYYDDCIYLNRKYDLVKVIKSWVRPEGMIISPKKMWTPEQDEFILTHEIEESIELLGRSENSIKMRLRRL